MKINELLVRIAMSFPESRVKTSLRNKKNEIKCRRYNRRPNGSQLKVCFRDGYFEYHLPKYDITINAYDDCFYEFEKLIDGYLAHYALKKGDFVVDAGAFVGAFTLVASCLVGKAGRVIAYEPDQACARKLRRNLAINSFSKNVQVEETGLWSSAKTLTFQSDLGAGSSIMELSNDSSTKESNSKNQVKVVCLDEEVKRLGLSKINFIKMDIEGSELEAVDGAKLSLKKFRPSLAIASYHLINEKMSYIALEAQLKKLGYTVQTTFPAHLTTYGWMCHS